jgi:hypothetical protein
MGGGMADLGPVWIGAVIAAVISSLVTAFGWYVSDSRERRAEARRRRDKIVDLQKALRAEARSHLMQLEETDLGAELAAMTGRMDADPAFVPFVPRESHDAVYRAVIADIHLLPSEAVEPVVLYHAHVAAMAAFADDLRSPAFAALHPFRRRLMYEDWIGMKRRALDRGRAAVAALDAGVRAVSSPDAGRSALRPEG